MKKLHSFLSVLLHPSRYLSRITRKNAGIITGAFLMVFIAGFVFRDKLPFFASTGNDPVAYWRFDEGTGTTAYDSVGSYDGSLGSGNSAPTWKSDDLCINGKCLQFDGSNDTVNLANDFLSNGSVSYSFWVKIFDINQTQQMALSLENIADLDFYRDDLGVGKFFRFGVYDGDNVWVTSTTSPVANQWYHISAVSNGSTISLYVNGNLEATANQGNPIFNTFSRGNRIGMSQSGGNPFRGQIDELKIYNYARTADQIKADYAARGGVKGAAARFGEDDINRKLSDGLVGYWKMDEVGVSGSNWISLDSSGNNNNGTGVGNATVGSTAPGKYGNGAYFDGNGDYISLNSEIALGSEHTICTWANPSVSDIGSVVAKESTTEYALKFYGGSSRIYYRVGGSSFYFSYTVDGQQHFFCQVRSNDVLKTYRDGVLINTLTGLGSSTLTIDRIGRDDPSTEFNGTIDELRIYKRSLAPEEVTELYQWAPGPVAHWKMDEGTGTAASDNSVNNLTSSLGSGNSSPLWIPAKYGHGLKFDGTDDYVIVSDNDLLTNSATMSWALWMKADTDTGAGVRSLLNKYNTSSERSWQLIYNGAGGSIGIVPSDNGVNNSQSATIGTVSAGQWHHIAATFNQGSIIFYINGKYDSTSTNAATSLFNNTVPMYIGSGNPSGSHFKGLIDDVRIYNYVRTPTQIVEDMNAGHPAVGTPVGSTVLHYKMDEGYGTTVNNWSLIGSTLNGNFGAGGSAPTWTNDGKFGKGILFDGTGDAITLQSIGNSPPLTVSFWAKPTFFGSWKILSTHCSGPQVYMYNNQWNLDHCGESSTAAAADATLNEWQHVTAVWENLSSRKIYVNGILKGTNTTTATTTSSWTLLGAPTTNLYGTYKGYMDEFKIYNFALTAEQVKTDMNLGKAQVMGSASTGLGGTLPSFAGSREVCVPGDASTCNAPIGEWLFNEGVGVTAIDTSTRGEHGMLGSGGTAPEWIPGKFGNGLKFDGTDDYVNLGDALAGSNSTLGSISLWFKSSSASISVAGMLFYVHNASDVVEDGFGGGRELHINLTSSKQVMFFIESYVTGTDLSITSTATYDDNKWHHVGAVWDKAGSGQGYLYVDGILAGSGSMSSVNSYALSGNIYLGKPVNGGTTGNRMFPGNIDDVRVYDYARTAAQIAWEYNRGAPVAYYKFDECTGSTAGDWAPDGNGGYKGNNGSLIIGSSGTQTSAGTCSSGSSTEAWNNGTTGKRNNSLSFDGTDDYVLVPDQDYLTTSTAMSWSFWIKPANGSTSRVILGKYDSTSSQRSWTISLWTPGFINTNFSSDGVNFQGVSATSNMTIGEWTHVVVTYNAGQNDIYYNGKLVTRGTSSQTSLYNNTTAMNIAANTATNHFQGQLDEVKIFNYVLTPQQIKTEYTGSAVRFQ